MSTHNICFSVEWGKYYVDTPMKMAQDMSRFERKTIVSQMIVFPQT